MAFHGGEGKGATSVLRNVGGRVDIDRSLHQDRYVPAPGVAGPSRQTSQRPPVAHKVNAPNAFDLGALRQHLQPSAQRPVQRENWAESFTPAPVSQRAAGKQRMDTQQSASPWQQDYLQSQAIVHQQNIPSARLQQPNTAPWQVPNQAYRPQYMPPPPQFFPPPQQFNQPYMPPMPPQQRMTFEARPPQTEMDQAQPEQRQERPAGPLSEPQELLARTARELVTDLDASSEILRENPKLAQSQFMQLMRGLGDGEVMVEDGKARINGEEVGEGAKFVSRPVGDWASAFVDSAPAQSQAGQVNQARTLPALAGEPDFYERQRLARNQESMYPDQSTIAHPTEGDLLASRPEHQRRKSVHFDENGFQRPMGSGVPNNLEEAIRFGNSIPGMGSQWEDEGLDLEDFDETAFMNYNGHLRQHEGAEVGVGEAENWGGMQRDWDELQRTEPGLKEASGVNRYLFQSRNPYATVAGDADMGRESPTLKGVLELEAAVQHDPNDHEAWFALGLKQQENEREDQAIRALSKVIELDPDYRPAYLALAVSYTNEGTHQKARVLLDKWIQMGEASAHMTETDDFGAMVQNHERLVERLIDLARASPEEVDPDVQIALGVLFNSSEEYVKAEDCFLAALSVRPDDWLLHNRLGATLANSGRSNEAISYYHKALSLHPSFVRALFNLGISYINLAQYPLAAQHIISAIRLQHTDATEAYVSGTIGTSAKGVTSESLWNSLRTACLHMGRHDLVEMAAKKDIAAFPDTFDTPVPPAPGPQSPPFNILPFETGVI